MNCVHTFLYEVETISFLIRIKYKTNSNNMAYKSEISFAKNKVETQKMLCEIIEEHLSNVSGRQFWADLPCKNFYIAYLATKLFGDKVKIKAFENKIYEAVRKSLEIPSNVDYIKGDILDSRNIKYSFVNGDFCSAYTEYLRNKIKTFIFQNEFTDKCVFAFNLVKQHGMSGIDYKENGFQIEITKMLYRKGFKNVKYKTVEYQNGTSEKSARMILSIFVVG